MTGLSKFGELVAARTSERTDEVAELAQLFLNCSTSITEAEAEQAGHTFDRALDAYRRKYHPEADRMWINCFPYREPELWAEKPHGRGRGAWKVWPLP